MKRSGKWILLTAVLATGCVSSPRPTISNASTEPLHALIQFSGPEHSLTLRVHENDKPYYSGTNYLIRLTVHNGCPRFLRIAGVIMDFMGTNDVEILVDGKKQLLIPTMKQMARENRNIKVDEIPNQRLERTGVPPAAQP